ncbi:hypothetical protein JCM11641_006590 [Rhodosporidiobolus odoratus]
MSGTPRAASSTPVAAARLASPSRSVPARASKVKIGSLAEPFIKTGGYRQATQTDQGQSRKKQKTLHKEEGRKRQPARDDAGRFLGKAKSGRKGPKKKTSPAKKAGGEGEEELLPTYAVLEDANMCRAFGSMKVMDYHRTQRGYEVDEASAQRVFKGDVCQVLQPGWYAQIEGISSLRDSLHQAPTWLRDDLVTSENKALRMSTKQVYIKLTWFWSKSEFEGSELSTRAAWQQQCQALGPNEVVKTDGVDWKNDSAIRATAQESVIYCLDDCYPARHPGALCPTAHPLSLYSPPTLSFLSPSPYALPALEWESSHSLTAIPVKLPSFFFGIGAESGKEGRGNELLDGGKDGRRGTPYVRIGFSFEKQRKGEDDSDKEGNAQSGKKAKKSQKKGETSMVVHPMTFVPHSTSRTPYNPAHVQVFSPQSKEWLNVSDLLAGKHYVDAQEQSPTSILTALGQRSAVSTSRNVTAQPSAVVADQASDRSSVSHSDATTDLLSSFLAAHGAGAGDPALTSSSSVLSRLSSLSTTTIVRGGAYGLTGNAYLVTHAIELLSVLSPSPPFATTSVSRSDLTAAQRSNAFAEARQLLLDARAWEKGVRERVEGRVEGKGLRKEWRATGEAPKGKRWICPRTKKEL